MPGGCAASPAASRRCLTRATTLATAGLVAGLVLLALPGLAFAAATHTSGSVELTAQTPWVGKSGTFKLSVKVTSTLPPSALALQLELYTKLPNRILYAETEENVEALSEGCLDDTGPLALTGLLGTSSTGVVTYRLHVLGAPTEPGCSTAAATTLGLACTPGNCDGVYPLKVSLLDAARGEPLASFTTHLIYTSSVSGSQPLGVGLVLPISVPLALGPNGRPTMSRPSVSALATTVGALTDHGSVRLTLAVDPSTLLALRRLAPEKSTSSKAATALNRLSTLLHAKARATPRSIELLRSPFVPLDVSSLVDAGLNSDFTAQLNRGDAELADNFLKRSIPSGPYLSTSPLDAGGLAELERNCISEIVVPERSAPVVAASALTPTAPFELQPSGTCQSGRRDVPEGIVADRSLSEELGKVGNDGAVLAAENFLGDLAQVYFEEPNAEAPREVVADPSQLPASPSFFSTIFSALRTSPILESETLSSLFSGVALGSNNNVPTATLDPGSTPPRLPSPKINLARRLVSVVTSMDPTNTALNQRLHDSVFLAESLYATSHSESAYLAAPAEQLHEIASEVTVSERTYTLTARTGKIPITILFSEPGAGGPLHVVVRLESSDIQFLSPARQSVELSQKAYEDVVQVRTRTSGELSMSVELLSATGGVELTHGNLTVRSTAVSGVAIALSVAAILVLLVWWVRSGLRRRGLHRRSSRRPEELTGAEP